MFSPKIGQHLAVIERFNRTLKTRVWKSLTANHNSKWKKALPKFMEGYNNSIHRIIGITSANLNKVNPHEIWIEINGGNYAEYPFPKFCEGDVVRLRQFKEQIQCGKSLDVNFTPELSNIRRVNRGIPNMYFIKSKVFHISH